LFANIKQNKAFSREIQYSVQFMIDLPSENTKKGFICPGSTTIVPFDWFTVTAMQFEK